MLPNVVICSGLLVHVVTLEAAIWRVLAINTPADSLGFQKIHNRLCTGVDPSKAVARNSIGIATDGCDIVWLRGVGDGFVVREQDALAGDP